MMYQKTSLALDQAGNHDVAAFFRKMAGYAKHHLHEVMNRAGIADISELPKLGYLWGIGSTPESIDLPQSAANIIDLDKAMALALRAERLAVVFYSEVAKSSSDPEVRRLAEEFAAEERDHVLALECFIGDKPR